ncbi:MAG: M15 family metallopeptidase, partial [Chitinophagales bacterium]
ELFLVLIINAFTLFYVDENELNPEPAVKIYGMDTPEFLTGKNDYYSDTNFIEIPASLAYRTKMFLLKDTYSAFSKMNTAAKKDGISLKIISAARTFEEQKWIWEDKWIKYKQSQPGETQRAEYIMHYSAMPGTSRHHWGTEIDLNSTSENYFKSGTGKKVYDWLVKNAGTYGFCQTYDEKGAGRSVGYNEEKWHWSYYPLSNKLLKKYKEKVKYADIKGFSGDGAAEDLDVINNYVLSISNDCE